MLVKFLLQVQGPLPHEKYSCSVMKPYEYAYGALSKYRNTSELTYVPVGSVEFCLEFCKENNIKIPLESLSYPLGTEPFLQRKITLGVFGDALPFQFVKPRSIKSFTGAIRSSMKETSSIGELQAVWISDPVDFIFEYRFYVLRGNILGWARYDNNDTAASPRLPSLAYIQSIYHSVAKNYDLCACAIDVGWRKDLNAYSLVEVNDAWALGRYTSLDDNGQPISKEDYALMIEERWLEITKRYSG